MQLRDAAACIPFSDQAVSALAAAASHSFASWLLDVFTVSKLRSFVMRNLDSTPKMGRVGWTGSRTSWAARWRWCCLPGRTHSCRLVTPTSCTHNCCALWQEEDDCIPQVSVELRHLFSALRMPYMSTVQIRPSHGRCPFHVWACNHCCAHAGNPNIFPAC